MKALPHGCIPAQLWEHDVVQMPRALAEIYTEYLKHLGRHNEALDQVPDDAALIGGSSDEATLAHFTHRFAVSAVRLEYVVLDPHDAFGEIPSDLLVTLTDGRIAVLDVPCGTGAGTLALLGTLAELRAQQAGASLPLTLHITAGDVASKALDIYQALLSRTAPWLRSQGIQVHWDIAHWDAGQPNTTAALVDRWFHMAEGAEEYVVLIAAFSGAGAGHFAEFQRSFQHITERLHDKRCAILWVEPRWNQGRSFLQKIKNLFDRIPWFTRKVSEPVEATFRWYHPIKHATIDRGSVLVKQYSRR